MFNKERFVTTGISAAIPLETQLYLWGTIDVLNARNFELDYLQIFELKECSTNNGMIVQEIIHKQEQPEYECHHIIKLLEVASCKIFVIDDITHSTMLLACEY